MSNFRRRVGHLPPPGQTPLCVQLSAESWTNRGSTAKVGHLPPPRADPLDVQLCSETPDLSNSPVKVGHLPPPRADPLDVQLFGKSWTSTPPSRAGPLYVQLFGCENPCFYLKVEVLSRTSTAFRYLSRADPLYVQLFGKTGTSTPLPGRPPLCPDFA